MPDEPRRLILKPPQATPEQLAELGQALTEAVSVQNRLAAKSPYILRFTGPVQEDAAAYYVPHEPATPWEPRDLFAPNHPQVPYDQLVSTTAALLDALAAAHGAGSARPAVHGGLCPGVMLTGDDGLTKLTDFGFAPAICKVLGVDDYLSLAAGPHPTATGAWEIVSSDVVDRDDRLCAFVDPDKYGQATLGTFEAGSDIIAAGFILRLLAEHRHPYLAYEPEAHRVVDMAQMMSFGVPVPVAREDLARNERSDVRAWCDLVAAMVARLPSERPPVAELVRRLKAFAPQAADVSVLKARRWVAQLEALRDAGAWRELEAALKDRPAVESWPDDLLGRADALAQQVRDRLAEVARQAAIQEQHRTAQKWFDRLRSAVQDAQWETARKQLDARPALEHWPGSVQRELDPVAAQVHAGLARQEAREWQRDLEEDYKARDWAAVGRRLETRPPDEHCPPEVRDAIHVIEAAYQKHLDEQERERRRIASRHSEVRGWIERARGLAAKQQWVASLDLLAAPPPVEHWPPGVREEAERLAEDCRTNLGDKVAADLDAVTAHLARQATAAVEATLEERLAGLLRPAQVEVAIEDVIWGKTEQNADGRAPVRVRLRPPAGTIEAESLRGELVFRLKGAEPQVVRGIEELRRTVSDGLRGQLGRLQEDRLAALERHWRGSVFKQLAIAAKLTPPEPQADVQLSLLGAGQAEGQLGLTLRWDDGALAWQPVDADRLRAQAVDLATAITRRATYTTLLESCPTLRTYEPALSLDFAAAPVTSADPLPRALAFDAKLTIRLGEQGNTEPLAHGSVTCEQVGQARLDPDFQQCETRLAQLIGRAQEESRKAWEARLKDALRSTPTKARLVAPGRIRSPVETLTFEIRPKVGAPVALSGPWDTKRFAFDLPGWEAAVGSLAPPPEAKPIETSPQESQAPPAPEAAPATLPEPRASARAAPGPLPEPAGIRAPSRSRFGSTDRRRPRGVIYGAAAAGVVVVAIGLYVGLGNRGESAAPPRPEESPRATDSTVSPPSPITTPPPDDGGEVTSPVQDTEVPQPAPPPDGTTERVAESDREPPPEPVVPPPREDALTSLRRWWQGRFGSDIPSESPIGDVLAAAAPADSRVSADFLASAVDGPAVVEDPQSLDENAISLTLRATLKAGGGAVQQALVLRRGEGEDWTPVVENAAAVEAIADSARASLRQVVAGATAAVAERLSGGELRAAHEQFETVREVAGLLEGTEEAGRLRETLASAPPAWATTSAALTAAGYRAEGAMDDLTGYPTRLQDAEGRELLLVSLAPTDELWSALASLGDRIHPDHPLHDLVRESGRRTWHLFYIGADEFPAGSPQAAAEQAAQRGGRLPTRDEWFIAALRLRERNTAHDLFGGLWEWCGTANGGYWLCGGSRVLAARQAGRLRQPSPTQDLATWWDWLTHPLVVQSRAGEFGDGLTGARSLLGIYPAP